MGSYAEYKKRKTQSANTAREPQPQEKTAYQQYKEQKKAAGGGTFVADLNAYMEDFQKFATAAETDSKNVG